MGEYCARAVSVKEAGWVVILSLLTRLFLGSESIPSFTASIPSFTLSFLKVIPPSQFAIHACKQYKRAVEYICLENGKSLLDLLRACRRAPLHELEATIQNFVRSPPEEKYFTCERCKGDLRVSYSESLFYFYTVCRADPDLVC